MRVTRRWCGLKNLHVIDQPYELAQAFKDAPHVALMNLSCDQDWAKFIARWGPLQMSDHERRQRRSRMQLDRCRAFQRFRGFVRLLDCFGRMNLEGEKLREFLKAAEEESRCWAPWITDTRDHGVLYCAATRTRRSRTFQNNFDEGFASWLRQADQRSVSYAVGHVIENVSFAATGCLVAEWEGVSPRITARLILENLEQALEWMLWNGYWMKKPQIFCQECRQAFWPESAHRRKYCSNECIHMAPEYARTAEETIR